MRNFASVSKKIVCVGRNYGGHIKELKNEMPTKPVVFFKPSSSIITEGEKIRIPDGCTKLQHEVELGIVIGETMSRVAESDAMKGIAGYCLALDMTARDFQEQAKKSGLPWTLAKGFDTACPVSGFIDKSSIADPHKLELFLKVNDEMRQSGSTSDMIFSIPYILAYISSFIRLDPGDLVLTGTPEGVSDLKSGDRIDCGIRDNVSMCFVVQ